MGAANDKMWYLQRTGLISQLSPADLHRLADLAELDHLVGKDTVFMPGETADKVYLLKAGRLKVSRIMAGGRKLTLTYLQPGEIFGELGGADVDWHESMVEAIERAIICRFKRETFEAFLSECPALSLAIAKRLNFRLKRIESRLADLLFLDVRSRILKVLDHLCDDFGVMTPQGKRLTLKLTHQDIADLIGATRETTTTALGELLRSGELALGEKLYVLVSSRTDGHG